MLRREIIERRNAGLKLCRLEGRPGSCPGLPDTVHLSELIADPFMQTRMLALVGAVYTHRPAQQQPR